MKKIAMILTTTPQLGGGHQYATYVAECLVKNMNQDYELIAISYNSFWRKWCRDNNVRCIKNRIPDLDRNEQIMNYRFSTLMKVYNSYMTVLGEIIRKENINILFPLQAIFIPRYCNVKIIVPVHDLMHRYEPRFDEVRRDYESREILMRSYAKYADVIFTDSKLGKKQFEESYKVTGKKSRRIISLPFTVSEHIFNIKEEKIDVPDKYIFYPAQFWKHKNHINLIKAIQLLKNRIKDIHLVLVGSEKNCCKEIKDYIKKNGLENTITILGFVSDENITYLYKHAIGMIMPSYFGPTNIPPLEAMALGCPVAVSKKYAMPEQVGNAGLLFDPDSPEEIAECIERLWVDQKLCEQLKELGHKRSMLWDKKKFNNRLLKILNIL